MVRRSGMMVLGAGALTGVLTVWSTVAGCQGGTSSTGTGGSSSGTNSGGGTTTSASTMSTGTGDTTTGGTGTTTSSATGTGGMGTGGAAPTDATITDITTNKVGPSIPVKLTGVVAMSQKFLVSQGKSGSCLWGVFVSEPNLAETKANSGILVLSYGTNASIADGGTKAFCPRLAIDPVGDAIPDDSKPGDVLDVVGETSYFLLPQCGMAMGDSMVAEYQIAKVSSCTKTGTAVPPKPHVMTAAEIDQLASPSDKAFHDQWGGVKVAVANVTSVPQVNGDAGTSITDSFGHIVFQGPTAKLQAGDKLYYQGYTKKQNFCHDGPMYANPATMFTMVEGISYLDFCTWSIEPGDKCADLAPPSDDCMGMASACQ